MNKYETIFILGIGALFFIGWLITCHLYSLQRDKNDDLQLENSDLITVIGNRDEEIEIKEVEISQLTELLAKKKELLEIQDSIIKELKHNQPQED